ncbi:MAG: ABC transporter transmembrane domain-containing protein, partial [Loktanella sp.]|nr:ABC transporter transmembrane domain-containing protein [Loktanella sp.]
MRPHKGTLAAAIFFMVIEGSMLGFLSAMIQPMFDNVFLQGERDTLWWVGIGILIIFTIRAVSSAAQKILITKVNQSAAAGMRSHLLRHLMLLDGGYHQVNPPGQLIERVQGDVTVVNNIWTALITGISRDL